MVKRALSKVPSLYSDGNIEFGNAYALQRACATIGIKFQVPASAVVIDDDAVVEVDDQDDDADTVSRPSSSSQTPGPVEPLGTVGMRRTKPWLHRLMRAPKAWISSDDADVAGPGTSGNDPEAAAANTCHVRRRS